MSAQNAPKLDEMNFEDALTELDGIVRKLENGQSSLEASITDYTRGTKLKEHCEAKLKEATLKVEKIVQNSDGSTDTEPFTAEG
ncbi:MAG: exodeoxyribonuclease VII small subunit [Rickettsiales bacterium]|nr:exodeoxyribonuclease VII small subunit [Rickettsiales bacterium]